LPSSFVICFLSLFPIATGHSSHTTHLLRQKLRSQDGLTQKGTRASGRFRSQVPRRVHAPRRPIARTAGSVHGGSEMSGRRKWRRNFFFSRESFFSPKTFFFASEKKSSEEVE
jgi:hypothetical protein